VTETHARSVAQTPSRTPTYIEITHPLVERKPVLR
jgi:hypothetical protein